MTPTRGGAVPEQADRRFVPALLVALLWVLATVLAATPAHAHAAVQSSTPVDGARLLEAPGEVSITFSEVVDAATAAIHVYDTSSARVDLDDTIVLPGDGRTVRASLPPDLPDGPYVAIWRAVGADGHTVFGKLDIRVGEAADGTVAIEPAVADGGAIAQIALGLRGAVLIGTLLTVGTGAFFMVALRSRPRAIWAGPQDAVRRWVRWGATVTVLASVASLPVEAAVRSGVVSLDTMLGTPLVHVINAPFGMTTIGRALVLLPFAVGFRTPSRGLVWTLWATSLLTLALDGHAVTASPPALGVTANLVHVSAGAVWFGGLVALGVVLRQARQHGDAIGMAEVVARFSSMALWAVVAASAAGAALAWNLVPSVEGLTTSTYGATLTAKMAAVAGVVAIGAYNRRLLVPRVARAARAIPAGGSVEAPAMPATSTTAAPGAVQMLRRTVAFEAVALVWVLALTAVLVSQAPPRDLPAVSGPAPVACAPALTDAIPRAHGACDPGGTAEART